MEQNEVQEAFEILLEEIEVVADDLNETGAEALRAGDYLKAKEAIDEATRLSEFREKVRDLQREWKALTMERQVHTRRASRKPRTGRLGRGLRTSQDALRQPILETLRELGGKAPVGEVLDRVENKMRDVLNEYDYQPLPSLPSCPRWRNTAQWCRNTLVTRVS